MGTHQNRLDAKGRVSIPAPFRACLRMDGGEGSAIPMVLRPHHNHPCIEGWPTAAFRALDAPLQSLSVFSPEYDDLAGSIYADAFPMEADREGRIVLPDLLAAHAGLTGSVVFMGMGRTFQIWEPEAAERRRADMRERARGLALPGIRIAAPAPSGGTPTA